VTSKATKTSSNTNMISHLLRQDRKEYTYETETTQTSHTQLLVKLLVPRTHNKLGDRSFSTAGPRLWNDLPPGLRRPALSFDSFRRSLKTHLFGD